MSVSKYLIALLMSFMSIELLAVDAQELSTPAAVLDALQQTRGDVVLALIDGPADQSNRLKNLQGLLSIYSLELNGVDLGQARRNDVLQVRPRLGLNKLIIRDAFKNSEERVLNFPAMRSAGVSTSIVEIQTSRQFSWIQALPLARHDVQAIHDALDRSQQGGIGRVIDLIRSRGKEVILSRGKSKNWISRRPNNDEDRDESNSDTPTSTSVSSRSLETAVKNSSTSSNTGPEPALDPAIEASPKETEKKSSVNISADRRSYY